VDLGPNVAGQSQEVVQHHTPVQMVTRMDALHAGDGVLVHLHRTVAMRTQSLKTHKNLISSLKLSSVDLYFDKTHSSFLCFELLLPLQAILFNLRLRLLLRLLQAPVLPYTHTHTNTQTHTNVTDKFVLSMFLT